MEQLLPYFERELVQLRLHASEFAARFPRVAGQLQLNGDSCGDPHVERMIEAFALIAARIVRNLDDDYSKFTESYLELLYPHYLRQFPSCAIVRLDPAADAAPLTLARGTELLSAPVDGVACRFRTAYPVHHSPLLVEGAQFHATPAAPAPPPGVRLPPGASASIAITLAAAVPIASLQQGRLRLFINGEASFCAALRDALFLHVQASFVATQADCWTQLAASPLQPVGLGEDDALIPYPARSHPAYRLLTEYFSFPDKFNFVDIDLAALPMPAGCRRLTLHLALGGLRADSNMARMLASLSAASLLTGCTPVVNLFAKHAVPISLTHTSTDCSVIADANHAHAYEVYSIDSVTMLHKNGRDARVAEFRPLYSLRHGEDGAAGGRYWVARRDELLASRSPGHETKISFVDLAFDPLTSAQTTVSLELCCSNRALPTRLGQGNAGGDLHPQGDAAQQTPLRFLRRPSAPARFQNGGGAHWRLISHLGLNHHGLAGQGVNALREMLALYDLPQSPASQRQIAALTALEHRPASAWVRDARGASLIDGIEVRISIDEEGFIGAGMHLFAQVIARYLGLMVQVNSFTELVIVSAKTGEELLRCPPSNGDLQLV